MGSVVCLPIAVSQSVPEMEGIYVTRGWGVGGHPFLKTYLWWNLRAMYLLACQVELPFAIQVSVGVVSLVC